MHISFIFTMASAIFLTSFLIYLHTYICYGQQNFFNHQNFKTQHGIPGQQKPIYQNNLTDGNAQLQPQKQSESFEPMQPTAQPVIQPVQNTQAFPVCNRGMAQSSLDAQPQALPNYAQRPAHLHQPQYTIQQRPPVPQTANYNPPNQNYWPAVPVVMETALPPRQYPIYTYDGMKNELPQVPYPQYFPVQYPSYPVNTVITDHGSQSSSLKTLLPIILNLLKEKNNCPCRKCECSKCGYCKKKYPLSNDGPEIETSMEMETIRKVREPKKTTKNVIAESVEVESSENPENEEE